MSKAPKVLFYGIIVNYASCQIVAVTTQKKRWGGMAGRWCGRLLRPGVALEDAVATNGSSGFIAAFDTREQAEAAYVPIVASLEIFNGERREADKARDVAVKAARERHEARISAIPGVREPAS